MYGLWIWWLIMKYRIKDGIELNECFSAVISHLEVWSIPLINITPTEINVDGEIPEDQLDHLGLEI
jgi:hypothetical protein